MVRPPRGRFRIVAVVTLCLCAASLFVLGEEIIEPAPVVEVERATGDYTADSLRQQISALEARYGGSYRDMPLAVKADFFEWQLWRYHQTPYLQVYNKARLPSAIGERPQQLPGPDSSTWNGALLAALAYKYAATQDAQTRERIGELLEGLHLFFEVTGQPGLPARNVTPVDGPIEADQRGRYTTADGVEYAFRSEAAKGTVNQLAIGYATLLMLNAAELPEHMNKRARDDLSAIARHLVEFNYHLTEANGQRTPYGDLTPIVARVGIPFNSQVAYLIVGAAHFLPSDDPAQRARIDGAYNYLRLKHHVYYEDPLLNLVVPQRIGGSNFVKGMNDRMHVTTAAFTGLQIDLLHARRHQVELDRRLVFQLGQTMVHSMEYLWTRHNSLCNFMWAALMQDRDAASAMLPRGAGQWQRQTEYALVDGVEQLRRFRLDRFGGPGREVRLSTLVYNDSWAPDDYYWKVNPDRLFQPEGPRNSTYSCAIDFLHAYWLMRYFQLDEHPAVRKAHLSVLAK